MKRRTKRLLRYGTLILVAVVVSVWIPVSGRFDLFRYVILFALIGGVGVANLRDQHRYVPTLMLAVAVLSVVLGVGRASIYGPTNTLAVLLFVLAIAFLVRGYQYRQHLENQ